MIQDNSLHDEGGPNPHVLSHEMTKKVDAVSKTSSNDNEDSLIEPEEESDQTIEESSSDDVEGSVIVKSVTENNDNNQYNHSNGLNHYATTSAQNEVKNNKINPSHISLSLENMYQSIINSNRNRKLNHFDIEQMSYEYLKEIQKIRISKEQSFMIRMIFDVMRRQSKEEKLKHMIDKNKAKLDEDTRIKGFNRLIEDANRRLEAQEQLELLKKKMDAEKKEKNTKRYKHNQWNEIYNERFMRYQEEKDKKLTNQIKEKQLKERQKEEEEIKLCKVKKAPISVIERFGKRMYEEAIKRKLKNNKNVNNNNNYNSTRFSPIDIDSEMRSEQQLKINLENILKEDEDDIRRVPKPITNTKHEREVKNYKGKDSKKRALKKKKTIQSTIPKLNPTDFIPKGNSCIHIEESKADKIVNEFFIKNLHQK